MDVGSTQTAPHASERRWRRRTGAWLLALAALIAVSGAHGAEAASRCRAPQELVRFNAPLHRFAAAVAGPREIKIVALGSSSTAGTGASGKSACYPARLETELNRRYPGKRISVANLGVGGQLARDMLPRIRAEVIPESPALVIWQTGVNDAIADVGLDGFRDTLRRGVDELTGNGIDVILLDMQYYPRWEYVAGYRDYLTAMRAVGKEKNVPVLHRFDIMKYWVASSQFSADELLAADHFHANDLTYGCLADILSDAMQDGLGRHSGSAVRASK